MEGRDFAVGVSFGSILAENSTEVTKERRLSLAPAQQAMASGFSPATCLDAFVEILA